MKNNKGFSIIELIVSFSICTVIVVILLQIILLLKDVYEKSAIKTVLLNKQNIIVDLIYEDIIDYGLTNITSCGDKCVTFEFNSVPSKKLSYSNNNLSYDDYTTPVISGTTVNTIAHSSNNNVIYVNLPIKHKLFGDTDFGIRIVHYLSD